MTFGLGLAFYGPDGPVIEARGNSGAGGDRNASCAAETSR